MRPSCGAFHSLDARADTEIPHLASIVRQSDHWPSLAAGCTSEIGSSLWPLLTKAESAAASERDQDVPVWRSREDAAPRVRRSGPRVRCGERQRSALAEITCSSHSHG